MVEILDPAPANVLEHNSDTHDSQGKSDRLRGSVTVLSPIHGGFYVNLSLCTLLKDRHILSIASQIGPCLRVLDLEMVYSFTDAGLTQLLQLELPGLQRLSLRSCRSSALTGGPFSTTLHESRWPSLVEVDLSFTAIQLPHAQYLAEFLVNQEKSVGRWVRCSMRGSSASRQFLIHLGLEPVLQSFAKAVINRNFDAILSIAKSCSDQLNSLSQDPNYFSNALLRFMRPHAITILVNAPFRTPSQSLNNEMLWKHALNHCIETSDEEGVHTLLELGADANFRDFVGKTPLCAAASCKKLNIVGDLLKKGADPNWSDLILVSTALQEAVRAQDVEITRCLLDAKASPDPPCPALRRSWKSPLFLACEGKNPELVEILLQYGGNPNFSTASSYTPTLVAYQHHRNTLISFLEHGAGQNLAYRWTITDVLTCAILKGDVPCVEVLIDRFPDLLQREHKLYSFPIIQAAQLGKLEILEFLISRGSDVNMRSTINTKGNSALHVATSEGFLDCVLLLLERGAHPDLLNLAGQTAAHIASEENRVDVLDILLRKANGNPHAMDMEGQTPLMAAVVGRNASVAEYLLCFFEQEEAKHLKALHSHENCSLRVCSRAKDALSLKKKDGPIQNSFNNNMNDIFPCGHWLHCVKHSQINHNYNHHEFTNQQQQQQQHDVLSSPSASNDRYLNKNHTEFDNSTTNYNVFRNHHHQSGVISTNNNESTPNMTSSNKNIILNTNENQYPNNNNNIEHNSSERATYNGPVPSPLPLPLNKNAFPLHQVIQPRTRYLHLRDAINIRDGRGRTVLALSISLGQFVLSLALLRHGASLTIFDENGVTPVDLLLSRGADFASMAKDNHPSVTASTHNNNSHNVSAHTNLPSPLHPTDSSNNFSKQPHVAVTAGVNSYASQPNFSLKSNYPPNSPPLPSPTALTSDHGYYTNNQTPPVATSPVLPPPLSTNASNSNIHTSNKHALVAPRHASGLLTTSACSKALRKLKQFSDQEKKRGIGCLVSAAVLEYHLSDLNSESESSTGSSSHEDHGDHVFDHVHDGRGTKLSYCRLHPHKAMCNHRVSYLSSNNPHRHSHSHNMNNVSISVHGDVGVCTSLTSLQSSSTNVQLSPSTPVCFEAHDKRMSSNQNNQSTDDSALHHAGGVIISSRRSFAHPNSNSKHYDPHLCCTDLRAPYTNPHFFQLLNQHHCETCIQSSFATEHQQHHQLQDWSAQLHGGYCDCCRCCVTCIALNAAYSSSMLPFGALDCGGWRQSCCCCEDVCETSNQLGFNSSSSAMHSHSCCNNDKDYKRNSHKGHTVSNHHSSDKVHCNGHKHSGGSLKKFFRKLICNAGK